MAETGTLTRINNLLAAIEADLTLAERHYGDLNGLAFLVRARGNAIASSRLLGVFADEALQALDVLGVTPNEQ